MKSAFFWLEIAGIWPNLAKSHQILLNLVEILLDLAQIWLVFAGFDRIFLQLRSGSSCSGFGDANPPFDSSVSVFENGNLLPTYWTFGLGQNQVGIRRFSRVFGLQSGLDNPTYWCSPRSTIVMFRQSQYLTLLSLNSSLIWNRIFSIST